jgi:hypothetical protein
VKSRMPNEEPVMRENYRSIIFGSRSTCHKTTVS